MERIYLVGYRCTGKTTVGRRLAERLQWAFCEMDRMIEDLAGKSISALFTEEGEELFRDLEESVLTHCSTVPEAVVSTGGGVVTRESNRETLKETGRVVWLRASVETIQDRMEEAAETGVGKEGKRPSLSGASPVEEVEEILEERRPLYESVADHQIQTDESPVDDIAEELSQWAERNEGPV